MATADLKIIYGSGGNIKASFLSGGLSISPGSSGVLLTITPPAGKLAILTSLVLISGAAAEPNIKITANGTTVYTGGITGSAQGGGASIGYSMGTGVGNGAPNVVFPPVISTTAIVIEKTTGSTVATLYYSYMFGE